MPCRPVPREVSWNGFTYRLNYSKSEQPPVVHVNSKLSKASLGPVTLSPRDIEGYASIYPRIYLVPRANQSRLRAWAAAHRDELATWDVSDFWNEQERDIQCGIEPRAPGFPPEVQLAKAIAETPKNHGNDDDGDAEDDATVRGEPSVVDNRLGMGSDLSLGTAARSRRAASVTSHRAVPNFGSGMPTIDEAGVAGDSATGAMHKGKNKAPVFDQYLEGEVETEAWSAVSKSASPQNQYPRAGYSYPLPPASYGQHQAGPSGQNEPGRFERQEPGPAMQHPQLHPSFAKQQQRGQQQSAADPFLLTALEQSQKALESVNGVLVGVSSQLDEQDPWKRFMEQLADMVAAHLERATNARDSGRAIVDEDGAGMRSRVGDSQARAIAWGHRQIGRLLPLREAVNRREGEAEDSRRAAKRQRRE